MTRPAYTGAGLRGPGQDLWPEQAKEHSRVIVLTDEAQPLELSSNDEAAAQTWDDVGDPIRCRLDPVGHDITEMRGAALVESTTHLISFDAGAPVTTDNRVSIDGQEWVLLAARLYTDASILRMEAKRA